MQKNSILTNIVLLKNQDADYIKVSVDGNWAYLKQSSIKLGINTYWSYMKDNITKALISLKKSKNTSSRAYFDDDKSAYKYSYSISLETNKADKTLHIITNIKNIDNIQLLTFSGESYTLGDIYRLHTMSSDKHANNKRNRALNLGDYRKEEYEITFFTNFEKSVIEVNSYDIIEYIIQYKA